MPPVISSVSSSAAERDAWKRAAELAGSKLPVWCRQALNAAAEATIAEAETPADRVPMRERTATAADPAAYIPPKLARLPKGATTVAIPADDADRYRQRGLVMSFIRAGGDAKDWTGEGPNPLQRGCKVRQDVLVEFAEKLDALVGYVADKAAARAEMRAAGVPA